MKCLVRSKLLDSANRRLARVAIVLATAGFCLPALAQSAPVAVAVRVTKVDNATRLAVDLSAPVAAHAFLLDKPDRVIIDLPEVNFQVDPGVGHPFSRAGGLIKSFRFGLFAPGKSRIVIDLAGPAILRRTSVDSIVGGAASRLTVELDRCDRASFRAALRHDQSPLSESVDASSPQPSTPADAKPVVVIDPGHGGVDPGASGIDGVSEKSIVFDFATALAAKLTAGGRYKVVMTRSSDSFVTLGDRVKIARTAGAALFVSVHADTLSDPSVSGATVYTASDHASDAEAARVAASENRADDIAGLEAVPDNPGVTDILFDLTRRETRTYAHLYQRTLVGYWQKIARLNRNPERSAGFKVLQAPDVPSVLLELGYLSSNQDSRLLSSPEWRDKASDGVTKSIDAFFAQRRSLDAALDPATTIAPPQAQIVSARSHP